MFKPWNHAQSRRSPFGIERRARDILRVLFRYRRLDANAGACADHPCEDCLALHVEKVSRIVELGDPLEFVLPAFPAKSPSPRKVIGRLPDMAEVLALGFLQHICDEIEQIYPPGARVLIGSDGRVFSDLVGITDQDVSRYHRQLAAEIARLGAHSLRIFSMDELFETADFDRMRAELVEHYALPLQVLEQRSRADERQRAQWCGIQRFLFEDRVGLDPTKSRSQVRKECGERAHRVIQRSGAWGRLIGERFPSAVRLSIHPQPAHCDKIGIRLAETDEGWLTPWHGVAVKSEAGFRLMHRQEAEALGARLVEDRGRPSHYDATGHGERTEPRRGAPPP
jgi:pyoverdine/dityrosine biosynthesis protein Dit1